MHLSVMIMGICLWLHGFVPSSKAAHSALLYVEGLFSFPGDHSLS